MKSNKLHCFVLFCVLRQDFSVALAVLSLLPECCEQRLVLHLSVSNTIYKSYFRRKMFSVPHPWWFLFSTHSSNTHNEIAHYCIFLWWIPHRFFIQSHWHIDRIIQISKFYFQFLKFHCQYLPHYIKILSIFHACFFLWKSITEFHLRITADALLKYLFVLHFHTFYHLPIINILYIHTTNISDTTKSFVDYKNLEFIF